MEAKQVAAGRGWQWVVQGFGLFRKNPLIWLALFAVYLIIVLALSIIPMVGPLVSMLLSPVFSAGFLLGCKALEQDEELELAHLFAGFRTNTAQLITVGGVYLVGNVVVAGIVMMLGGGSLLNMGLLANPQPDPALLAGALGGMMLALLGGLLLLVPLLMAYWFAPALVVFDNMHAVDAMKLSFAACWRNMVPFLVYGLVTFVLAMLAAIPFGLGFLVLVPTITASFYASYKDVFGEQATPEPLQDAA